MSQNAPLTPPQQKALALIATGSTVAAAATEAGVHRNTIGNWLRSSNFRIALELACLNQAIAWRDKAHEMAEQALAAIQAILTDPKAPAAVRLRAALAILEKAAAPLPKLPAEICEPLSEPEPEEAPPMHNSAQPPNEINRMQASKPEESHKPAQPPASGSPRNQPCPCGSGLKFKRCCLNAKTKLALNVEFAGQTGPQSSALRV